MALSLDAPPPYVPDPPVFERGDHIRVWRGSFWHHGLYIGAGNVIHRAGDESGGKASARVRHTTLQEFADGAELRKVEYGQRLSPEESVARAEECLGRDGYNLTADNCEHFVTWCVTGDSMSAQVEDVISGATFVGGAAAARHAGVKAVTGAGTQAIKSGPNIMSGLKSVGGGSAAAGVGLLAVGGAVVGAGSMSLAFRDRPHLPAEERSARTAARIAGAGGAALGASGVVYAVGALGVPGYGAAGLSSGLAAVGTPLGGGMVAGVAAAALAPVVVAGLFAIAFFLLLRWLKSRSEGDTVSA